MKNRYVNYTTKGPVGEQTWRFDKEEKNLTMLLDGEVQSVFSMEKMEELVRETKNWNRIHKPFALLFYIDAKNGDLKNWNVTFS